MLFLNLMLHKQILLIINKALFLKQISLNNKER